MLSSTLGCVESWWESASVEVCERAWRHVPVNSCVSRGLEVSPSPLARDEAFTPFSFHAVEAAQSVPPRRAGRTLQSVPPPWCPRPMPKPDSRFQTPDHAPDARPWSGRRALGPCSASCGPRFSYVSRLLSQLFSFHGMNLLVLCRLETLIQCLQLSSSRV